MCLKQPRAKRMTASTTGVVRAIVGGSRFTQQPCDMPLYGRTEVSFFDVSLVGRDTDSSH